MIGFTGKTGLGERGQKSKKQCPVDQEQSAGALSWKIGELGRWQVEQSVRVDKDGKICILEKEVYMSPNFFELRKVIISFTCFY